MLNLANIQEYWTLATMPRNYKVLGPQTNRSSSRIALYGQSLSKGCSPIFVFVLTPQELLDGRPARCILLSRSICATPRMAREQRPTSSPMPLHQL